MPTAIWSMRSYRPRSSFQPLSYSFSYHGYIRLFWRGSRNQATLGKLAIGAAVTDMQGNRITFARGSLRFFGKVLCVLTLFIGFLLIAFTTYRQGLHDKIAGTLVFRQ